MKQIERLIARVVQVVEDSPANIVTIVIVVDEKGNPTCWRVTQSQAEGLQIQKA